MATGQEAIAAIEVFLKDIDELSEDVIESCQDVLQSIWGIENPHIQRQIILCAAVNVGLIDESDTMV